MSVGSEANERGGNFGSVPDAALNRLHFLATSPFSPSTRTAFIKSYVGENARQPFYHELCKRAKAAIQVITGYRPHKTRMHAPPTQVSCSELGDTGVFEFAEVGLELRRDSTGHDPFGDLQDRVDAGELDLALLTGGYLLEGDEGLDKLDFYSGQT